uniref:Uncharacterized protein n=1 Tax=Anguilla anguilla TaxID=7936 RepID=A0A0E9R1C8_ANGAN
MLSMKQVGPNIQTLHKTEVTEHSAQERGGNERLCHERDRRN